MTKNNKIIKKIIISSLNITTNNITNNINIRKMINNIITKIINMIMREQNTKTKDMTKIKIPGIISIFMEQELSKKESKLIMILSFLLQYQKMKEKNNQIKKSLTTSNETSISKLMI